MPSPQIVVDHLTKSFRVAERQSGALGALTGLVRRRSRAIDALKGISFTLADGELLVKKLNREPGVTVILTTHDMHDIEALTGRVIVIGNGLVLADGTLAALRRGVLAGLEHVQVEPPSIEEVIARFYALHALEG